MSAGGLSKSKVDHAGDLMREYLRGGAVPLGDEFERAVAVVSDYRTLHAHPLQVTAAGLRYYVEKNTKARPITVGQRLKRFPTIIDKLCREPKMKLAYTEFEMEHRGDKSTEVVLVGADSIDTIRKTHSHYFADRADELFRQFLEGVEPAESTPSGRVIARTTPRKSPRRRGH